MSNEFLHLKLFGPQELLPLVKKYRKLTERPKPESKKPKTSAALKQDWRNMQ